MIINKRWSLKFPNWIICVEIITEIIARCQIVFWKSRRVILTAKTGKNLALMCENWKWPLVSLTSIISAFTWPNIKSKDSFEILRTSRFHNLPYFLNVVKIWWRYCLKTNHQVFLWTCITMTRNWRFRGTKP